MSVLTGRAIHSLFICSKKLLCGQGSLVFFEQTNNLRTVARLGVDKLTSHVRLTRGQWEACELANTLRLEEEEEENYLSFFRLEVTF